MATRLAGNGGHIDWSMSRDEEGHRTYKITYLVEGDSTDGPANVLQTPGLPYPGAYWLVDDDIDVWAWCRQNADVKPKYSKEPNYFWEVEFTFSTKPYKKCTELQFEDPLLEPQKVSGTHVATSVEATFDRFGFPIVNSAWERIKGKEIEFDEYGVSITVEQNVAVLDLAFCEAMVNTLNDSTMWGLAPRSLKLKSFDWSEKWRGTCERYYTRKFEFVTNPLGWDRVLLDEGTKVLKGAWNTNHEWTTTNINGAAPDPYNPRHFIKAKDVKGDPMKMVLNGAGLPAGVIAGSGQYFIAKTSSTGQSLTNRTYWLPCSKFVNPTPTWRQGAAYPISSIVTYADDYYVALKAIPKDSVYTIGDAGVWETFTSEPVDRGHYSSGTAYVKGDIVRDAANTGAGYIYVTKYGESNFLLLGVPVVLGP